jgi:hypothetical protein
MRIATCIELSQDGQDSFDGLPEPVSVIVELQSAFGQSISQGSYAYVSTSSGVTCFQLILCK